MKQYLLIASLLWCSLNVSAWTPYEVSPVTNIQQAPAVSGDIIVWQEYVQIDGVWDWDIYGVDLVNDPSGLIAVAALNGDQTHPSIWNTWVVWEHTANGDPNVWLSDITDPQNVQTMAVCDFENNQAFPRVHGNTVVWQDEYVDPDTQAADWDIYAADITNPDALLEYTVVAMEADQQLPDVYRTSIVWQDNYFDDNDILLADVWRRDAPDQYPVSEVAIEQNHPAINGKYVIWREEVDINNTTLYGADISDPAHPIEFVISNATSLKNSPALSGHLVVWQDNRAGNWDIYGYNLITRQEFPITEDTYNQTSPAIDGLLVAYEDDRYADLAVFGVYLDGPQTASCSAPVEGDVNGDCRVNLEDLTAVAAQWLVDALVF